MKRPGLILSICSVVVVLGWIGVRHEARAQLQRSIANFRAHLPADAHFDYRKSYPRILARGAGFDDVRFTSHGVTVDIHRLLINNPSGLMEEGLTLSKIQAEEVHVVGPQPSPQNKPIAIFGKALSFDTVTWDAQSVFLRHVRLPPIDHDQTDPRSYFFPLEDLRFRDGLAKDLRVTATTTLADCSASVAQLDLSHFLSLKSAILSTKSDQLRCREPEKIPDARVTVTKNRGDLTLSIGSSQSHLVDDVRTFNLIYNLVTKKAGASDTLLASSDQSDSRLHDLTYQVGPYHLSIQDLSSTKKMSQNTLSSEVLLSGIQMSKNGREAIPFLPPSTKIDVVGKFTKPVHGNSATQQLSVLAPNMFALTVNWSFSPFTLQPPHPQMGLREFDIHYRDDGLLTTLFAATERQTHMTREDFLNASLVPQPFILRTAADINLMRSYLMAPEHRELILAFEPNEPIFLPLTPREWKKWFAQADANPLIGADNVKWFVR